MALDPRQMNRRGFLEAMLREAGLGPGPLPPPNMQGRNPLQAPDPRRVYQARAPRQQPMPANVPIPQGQPKVRPAPRPVPQPQARVAGNPAPVTGNFQERRAAAIASENPGIFAAALKEALTANITPYKNEVENKVSKIMPAIKALREHNIEHRRLMKKANPKHGSVQA